MKRLAFVIFCMLIILLPFIMFFQYIVMASSDTDFQNIMNENYQDSLDYKYIELACKGIETKIIDKKTLESLKDAPICLAQRRIDREPSFTARLWLISDKTPDDLTKVMTACRGTCFLLNPSIVLSSESVLAMCWEIQNRFLWCLSILLIEFIFLISFAAICINGGTKKILSVFFSLVFLFFSVLTSIYVCKSYILDLRKINFTSSDIQIIKNFASDILANSKNTTDNTASSGQIIDMPIKIKNIGLIKGFVGKKPIFATEHVRFNINPFEYLIYTHAKPENINPQMYYERLSDNLWVGKYLKYIYIANMSNICCYIFIFLIWLIFIAWVLFLIKGSYLLESFTCKLKSDKNTKTGIVK